MLVGEPMRDSQVGFDHDMDLEWLGLDCIFW